MSTINKYYKGMIVKIGDKIIGNGNEYIIGETLMKIGDEHDSVTAVCIKGSPGRSMASVPYTAPPYSYDALFPNCTLVQSHQRLIDGEWTEVEPVVKGKTLISGQKFLGVCQEDQIIQHIFMVRYDHGIERIHDHKFYGFKGLSIVGYPFETLLKHIKDVWPELRCYDFSLPEGL